MKSNDKIDRNQFMMTSLDEMIDENSNVRVIDAYVQSLDVQKLGYQVYANKVEQFGDGAVFVTFFSFEIAQFLPRP